MADQFDRIREALADRYALERVLGSGGMATVYLARDVKHHREVAVKVLYPELSASLGAERFLREIEIAANLSHPHILPMHDSGEAAGYLFYVMPYVDGESLGMRIVREKYLPVEEAIRIIAEAGDGLAYAHEQGVIHRDIKPDNIMMSAGHAVIADFGIARAITSAEAEQLTQTGLAVGTPAYMSPEQASADELDASSDLYSLACVLYEVLAGHPPFTGPTPQAVMARHARDPAPPLRTVRETVSPVIDAVIQKALAKVPADRFGRVREFVSALTNPETTVVTVGATRRVEVAENSIAVVPFTNMSPDPEAEYFSDGVTEEITNALAQVPGLQVAARTSAFAFKGRNVDLSEVARTLQVSKILEGSVRQAGNRLRVTAQLINADGYHVWSERYDRDMTDVFAVQDELTAAIVEALRDQLGGAVATPIKRGTENLEAYHLFLKGRHFWDKRALGEALKCFEQAIALDPAYAAPYAGVADAFTYLGHYGLVPTPQAAPKAMGAAEKAATLDPELADAHFSLGLARLFFWYLDEAEAAFRRAIELNPEHALARAYLGVHLATVGREDEVRDVVEPARELEPLSPIVNGVVGIAYTWGGDLDAALEATERALEIDPTFLPALYMRGSVLAFLGRHAEGIGLLERAAGVLPCSVVLQFLGGAYADAGQFDRARGVVARLEKERADGYVTAESLGYIHAKLGEIDEAIGWIERAFQERNTFAWTAGRWPGLEHLASDPRYRVLLKKAGVEQFATA